MFMYWKYDIPIKDGIVELELPKGALIQKVDAQHGKPVFWAMFSPDINDPKKEPEKEKRYFKVYGTGQLINEPDFKAYQYHGTFQMCDGNFVGHFYELLAKIPTA